MIQVYDRNRNAIIPGQKVMIAATGEVSVAQAIDTQGLPAVKAERAHCVQVKDRSERFVPYELIRLA